MYIKDLKKLKKEAAELREQAATIYAQAEAKTKELQEKCHHPQQYVEVKEDYFEGSYYDRASTTYTPVCKLCGAKGESKREAHSWYG